MDAREELLAALTDGIVEDEWALRSPRGVQWWPHDLAQVISVTSDGGVAVSTELVREVRWGRDEVAWRLAGANRVCPLSTLVVTTDGVVRLRATGHVGSLTSPVLGWLRWVIAAQPADARFWAAMPEDFDGLRAATAHHRGMRELPALSLALAADLAERSWSRVSAVDPGWVGDGLARLAPEPRWVDESRSGVRLPWHVSSTHPERWAGRDDLVVRAWLQLSELHGPAVVVRTDVPYYVPARRSAGLASCLNPAPPSPGVALHSTWHGRERDPGVYLQAALPLGVLDDAVGDGPGVVSEAVLRVARAQRAQAAEVVRVVEAAMPGLRGPDPWLVPAV